MSVKIRSIKDTFIGTVLNMPSIFNEINKIQNNPEEFVLSQDHIRTISSEIKSKITSYGKMNIIDDLANGYTKVVNTHSVPLTGWVVPSDSGDNGFSSVANLFGKVRVNKDAHVITFPVREVFGTLLYAHVNRKFIENTRKIQLNSQLTSNCTLVYTRMIMRLIDSTFATSSIPVQSGAIAYCVAKFFIRYVMCREIGKELENDICYSVAKRHADVTQNTMLEYVSKVPDAAYEDAQVFFKTLANQFTILRGMDINMIMRRCILQYGEKSMFMIELFPAFLGYTIASTYSSNLIKDYIFETVLGKEGSVITSTFLSIVK